LIAKEDGNMIGTKSCNWDGIDDEEECGIIFPESRTKDKDAFLRRKGKRNTIK